MPEPIFRKTFAECTSLFIDASEHHLRTNQLVIHVSCAVTQFFLFPDGALSLSFDGPISGFVEMMPSATGVFLLCNTEHSMIEQLRCAPDPA